MMLLSFFTNADGSIPFIPIALGSIIGALLMFVYLVFIRKSTSFQTAASEEVSERDSEVSERRSENKTKIRSIASSKSTPLYTLSEQTTSTPPEITSTPSVSVVSPVPKFEEIEEIDVKGKDRAD